MFASSEREREREREKERGRKREGEKERERSQKVTRVTIGSPELHEGPFVVPLMIYQA